MDTDIPAVTGKAQKALGFAESVVDAVQEPLVILDERQRIVKANHSFHNVFLVSPEETEGAVLYEVGGGPWDIPELRRLLQDTGPLHHDFSDFEVRQTFPTIGYKVLLLSARTLPCTGTGTTMLLLTIDDVTEQRRVEEELRDRMSLASLVTETLPISLLYTDAEHRLQYANQVYLRRLSKPAEAVLGKPMREILGDENYEKIQPYVARVLQGERQNFEVSLRYPDIGERDIHIHYEPVLNAVGQVEGLVTAIEDITERKQAENALRQANETLEMRVTARTAALEEALAERQELLRRIVQTQEDERRHISRELHDQTGQHLSGLVLGLQALEENIGRYCPPEAGAETQIGQLRDIATALAQDIHRMAVDLRPTALDDLGLVPVLETHIAHWSESSGIPSEFDAFGLDKRESGGAGESGGPGESGARLPSAVETTVFRVVQEALTNVARHGTDPATRATRVSVTLQVRGDQLQATIEDNGPGFAVEAARRSGRLGLVGMEERAASVGGTLDIESEPGEGTTVYLRIPLASSAKQGDSEAKAG